MFKPGDKVVYPHHGAAVIVKKEKKKAKQKVKRKNVTTQQVARSMAGLTGHLTQQHHMNIVPCVPKP